MNTNMMEYDARKKSTVLAYLAWLFLGGLGVHRFYLGRARSGGIQLALTVIGLLLTVVGIGPLLWIVVGVWLLIDMFLIPGMVSDCNVALARSLQPVQRPPAHGALARPTKREQPDLHKWAD